MLNILKCFKLNLKNGNNLEQFLLIVIFDTSKQVMFSSFLALSKISKNNYYKKVESYRLVSFLHIIKIMSYILWTTLQILLVSPCNKNFLNKKYYFKVFYFLDLKITYLKCNIHKRSTIISSNNFNLARPRTYYTYAKVEGSY